MADVYRAQCTARAYWDAKREAELRRLRAENSRLWAQLTLLNLQVKQLRGEIRVPSDSPGESP